MAELLFWPALLAYGEAAVAYAGDVRHPGSLGRLATWGVRIGWLVQTALLIAQAVRADGFPWDTWAGSLNLFVWLVVGAYLIWGCRPRFRLLGLVVMPLAALLLAVSHDLGVRRRHLAQRRHGLLGSGLLDVPHDRVEQDNRQDGDRFVGQRSVALDEPQSGRNHRRDEQ